MASGGSGVHMETVPEVVVEEFSWPRESVTTLSLRMEANTATGFALSTAPVTTTPVQKQVKVSPVQNQDPIVLRITIFKSFYNRQQH